MLKLIGIKYSAKAWFSWLLTYCMSLHIIKCVMLGYHVFTVYLSTSYGCFIGISHTC